jgi:hypothetical protein
MKSATSGGNMKRILCVAGLLASGLAHSAILTAVTGNLVFPTASFGDGADATSSSYPAIILDAPAEALVIGNPDNATQPQVLKAGAVIQLLLGSEDQLTAISRSPGKAASINCDQIAVQSTEHHFAPYTCRVSAITFAPDLGPGETVSRSRGNLAPVIANGPTGTPGTFDEATGKMIPFPASARDDTRTGHDETRWSQRRKRHGEDASEMANNEPPASGSGLGKAGAANAPDLGNAATHAQLPGTAAHNATPGASDGVKVSAHGMATVPDAIVCRDSATTQLLFDLYNRSSHAAAARGEGSAGGRAKPTTWGCVRVAAGTAMTLHPGSAQPEVSVTLSDGTQYRGITLDGMVQR